MILRGTVLLNNQQVGREGQVVMFDRFEGSVMREANSAATALILPGERNNEPIAGHGPFVMNTRAKIIQAIEDFDSGRFGPLSA